MIPLGISTQAHVIDVPSISAARETSSCTRGLRLRIYRFYSSAPERDQGHLDTERHDLRAEGTTLRSYKGEQFLACSGWVYLPEATALVHLSFESALSDSLQGVLHVGNTP